MIDTPYGWRPGPVGPATGSGSLLRVPAERARSAIIGVGNALRQDDAFGPWMIRRLERGSFRRDHPAIDLVDAGTAGFDLMYHLVGRARVLLLDAVAPRPGDTPGGLRVLTHTDLRALRRTGARGSPHEPSILSALQVAELAGELPEVTLIGVVPLALGLGTEPTPRVQAAMEAAEQRARAWAKGFLRDDEGVGMTAQG